MLTQLINSHNIHLAFQSALLLVRSSSSFVLFHWEVGSVQITYHGFLFSLFFWSQREKKVYIFNVKSEIPLLQGTVKLIQGWLFCAMVLLANFTTAVCSVASVEPRLEQTQQ